MNDDTEKSQQASSGGGVRRLEAVAALDGAGVALASRDRGAASTGASGSGGRKGCKGDGRNGGELELHVENEAW